MANQGTMKLLVLWEHELRAAAALFDAYYELPKDADQDTRFLAAQAAFDAASAALNGLKPGVQVVLCTNRMIAESIATHTED